jgi:hypothetical protein
VRRFTHDQSFRAYRRAFEPDRSQLRCNSPASTPATAKNGEISRKHGNTLIRTLRETYGPGFAPGCDPNAKLSDCLHQIDEQSLSQLVHDRR